MVGKIVGNYKIIGKIGSGGMGRVYKAVHRTLDRVVAMKMIHPNFVSDPESVNRFRKEAKIQAQLSHPNIVTVYDFLEFDGSYFIIMEYVHGESIGKIVAERGYFEPRVALAVFSQILNGIKYAHSNGVIHRDIKPSNLILTPVIVKITDFGIARIIDNMGLTMTGGVVGTPKYMSPEQILGEKTDHRTDIYSLGVAFYEMLTGRVPFSSDTNSDYEIKWGHIELPPPPPTKVVSGIPKKLEGAVLKALSKKPEERFQSVDEFIASLESIRLRKRKVIISKDEPLNLDNIHVAKSDNSQESTTGRTEKEESGEKGNLDTVSYPALLISSYSSQKTGFLVLDSQVKIKIYFIEGFVAFVEGEEPRLALGEILIDRSKINRSDREEALSFAHDTGLKIGEALIKMGKITPHELSSALETQIKEKLVEGFRCKNGFYRFKDVNSFVLEATYKINPVQVIYEGVSRFFGKGEIPDGTFYDTDSSVTLSSNIKEELKNVIFRSSKELKLVEFIREEMEINEVISKSPINRDDTLRFLYFLSLSGLAKIHGRKPGSKGNEQVESNAMSASVETIVLPRSDKTIVLTEREIYELRQKGYIKRFGQDLKIH